jgi:cell division initiation protein
MKIAPLDVTQQSFRRVWRGLDAAEVEIFLAQVAAELEQALKEVQGLRDELRRKDEELTGMRGRERALQDALIAAQKAADEIRESARKEAEITLSGAELQAEKIVQGAHQRYVQVVEEINEMKRQRTHYESALRSLLEGHLKLLEAFGGADEAVDFLPKKKRGE